MTDKQRKFIIERDGHKCQHLLFRSGKVLQCFETNHLEVHHILSRRFMEKWFEGVDPDFPGNMITLCKFHHDEICPDIKYLFKDTNIVSEEAMNELFAQRDFVVAKGKPYWITSNDGIYCLIAKRNNDNFKEVFPAKLERKKNEH